MLISAFGMQLHAAVTIDGRDRNRLERVCSLLRSPSVPCSAPPTDRSARTQARGPLTWNGVGEGLRSSNARAYAPPASRLRASPSANAARASSLFPWWSRLSPNATRNFARSG